MNYVFVGDIHGKVSAVEAALEHTEQVIFVGDFIDSWHQTPAEHDKCYQLVLDAVEAKKARAIFGNHELSYLPTSSQMPHHRCSGFDYNRRKVVERHEERINALFEPYILLTPSVLVSHAGLTEHIWNHEELTLELLPRVLDGWWKDMYSPMHWIGHYRGGKDTVGGLFWCDFNAEFKPIPELTQIFGHTAGQGIRQVGNSFCIDCLDKCPKDQPQFLKMAFE